MSNTTREELLHTVDRLVVALRNIDNLADYFGVPVEDAIDTLIESMLDTDYIYNAWGELQGAEIVMTFGGPTLWIETRYGKVCGRWGTEMIDCQYYDGIGLDDLVSDLAPHQKENKNV